jgi:hypothetical protein
MEYKFSSAITPDNHIHPNETFCKKYDIFILIPLAAYAFFCFSIGNNFKEAYFILLFSVSLAFIVSQIFFMVNYKNLITQYKFQKREK